MTRALAILAALALALLTGCASTAPQAQTADAFADVDDALDAAAQAITEGHKVLAALHDAERARIEATVPDAETGHRQIAELHARYLPRWDAYEALVAAYAFTRATTETARAAVAAGRRPNALLLGRAVVRLAIASEDLWRAIETLGQPRGPAATPTQPGAWMAPPKPGATTSPPNPAAEVCS